MEKKTVLENLDLVLLAMDETVDGGCALCPAWRRSTRCMGAPALALPVLPSMILSCPSQKAAGRMTPFWVNTFWLS